MFLPGVRDEALSVIVAVTAKVGAGGKRGDPASRAKTRGLTPACFSYCRRA